MAEEEDEAEEEEGVEELKRLPSRAILTCLRGWIAPRMMRVVLGSK